VEELGGAFGAIDELKRRLVRSQAERVRASNRESRRWSRQLLHRDRGLTAGGDGEIDNVLKVDHKVEAEQIDEVER